MLAIPLDACSTHATIVAAYLSVNVYIKHLPVSSCIQPKIYDVWTSLDNGLAKSKINIPVYQNTFRYFSVERILVNSFDQLFKHGNLSERHMS